MFSHIHVTVSRNRPNLIGQLFFLKNYKKIDCVAVETRNSWNCCQEQVGQVCFGLESPVMHFCANVWCTFLYLLFECTFPGVVLFSVCNCCCYFLLNCQNSVAFFLHVVFSRFSSCLYMRCAQLFICLLACLFGCWHYICNSLVYHISCNDFVNSFTHFCCQNAHFSPYCCFADSCRCRFRVFGVVHVTVPALFCI